MDLSPKQLLPIINHPSINASRIARRVMKGGHDVPITKAISRYYKSLLNCRRVSLIADRTYILQLSQIIHK